MLALFKNHPKGSLRKMLNISESPVEIMLRELKIQLNALKNCSVIITDEKDRIIEINDFARENFGDIKGKNFRDMFNVNESKFEVFFKRKHYDCFRFPVIYEEKLAFAIFLVEKAKEIVESERIFKILTEKSLVGIFLLEDDKIRYANPKFAEIMGYNVEELIGKSFLDFIQPEDAKEIEECVHSEEIEKSCTIRVVRKDEDLRILNVFVSKILNENTIVVTAVDVTEQEEYRERLEEYKRFFENAQDLFFILDNRGRFLNINPKFAEIMGYDLNEIIGKNSKNLVHPEDLERLRMFFKRVLGGEIVRDEFRAVTKDGKILWFDIVEWPILKDDEVVRIEGIVREISKRKELEEKYKLLFYQSPIAITLADKGKFIEVNNEFEKLSGYERNEIIGRCFLDFVAEDDRRRIEGYYRNRLAGKEAPTRYVYKLLRKDGKIRFVESKVLKLPDNKTLTCRIDITERIRYERLLETMYRINRAIFLERDTEKLLRRVVSEIGEWCDFAIAICNSVVVTHGIDAFKARDIIECSKCLERALENKKFISIRSGMHPKDCKYSSEHRNLNTYIFPIVRRDRVFGALFISSKDALSVKEVEMIRTVINDLSLALTSIELEKARMEALEQIEQNIEQMATIVDKIRNPLAEIIGFAELEKNLEYRNKIIEAAYKIEKLVKQLDQRWVISEEIREFLSKLRSAEGET